MGAAMGARDVHSSNLTPLRQEPTVLATAPMYGLPGADDSNDRMRRRLPADPSEGCLWCSCC